MARGLGLATIPTLNPDDDGEISRFDRSILRVLNQNFQLLGSAYVGTSDGLTETGAKHFAHVRRSSAVSIPDNTATAIGFNTLIEDTDEFTDVSFPTRFTIPTGMSGVYSVEGNFRWDTTPPPTLNTLGISLNGMTSLVRVFGIVSAFSSVFVNTVKWFDEGDYLELYVYQASGGAMNVAQVDTATVNEPFSPQFRIIKVR